MSKRKIKYIEVESLKLIRLQPGDFLVFEAPDRLARDVTEAIRNEMARILPGIKVLILDSGMKVSAFAPPVESNQSRTVT